MQTSARLDTKRLSSKKWTELVTYRGAKRIYTHYGLRRPKYLLSLDRETAVNSIIYGFDSSDYGKGMKRKASTNLL